MAPLYSTRLPTIVVGFGTELSLGSIRFFFEEISEISDFKLNLALSGLYLSSNYILIS
jgi:hypothetical protein